jgi:polar amino acid transport system substrate-binding protein
VTRKLVPLAAAAAALALAAGCGSSDADSSAGAAAGSTPKYGDCHVTGTYGSHPIKPTTAGELTVETSLPSPGWWNGDTPAQIKSGYEYCMAANIAYRGGLRKLHVKPVSFDAIVSGKTRGFDLAMVTISITPERKKVVDFSVPYFSGDIGVLVKKGTQVTPASLKQMTVGVQLGTVGQNFAQSKLGIPSGSLKVFPDTASMTTALASGQVAAVLNDTVQCLNVAKQSGETLNVVGQFRTGESYGAVYPQGSVNEKAIDAIISELKADGTLNKLSATHLARAFGADPTQVPYLELQ